MNTNNQVIVLCVGRLIYILKNNFKSEPIFFSLWHLLKLYGALGQIQVILGKNLTTIRKSY